MDRSFWTTVAASTLGVLIAVAILYGLAWFSDSPLLRGTLGRLNKSVVAYPVKPVASVPLMGVVGSPAAESHAPYTGPLRIAPSDIPAVPASSLAALSPEARERARQDGVKKEAAWQKFYQRPSGCEKADGPVFIECANQHIRARRSFETLYAAGKL